MRSSEEYVVLCDGYAVGEGDGGWLTCLGLHCQQQTWQHGSQSAVLWLLGLCVCNFVFKVQHVCSIFGVLTAATDMLLWCFVHHTVFDPS